MKPCVSGPLALLLTALMTFAGCAAAASPRAANPGSEISSADMTPSEIPATSAPAASPNLLYRTPDVDGNPMPVFSTPVPTDASGCPAMTPGKLLLREERHAYCLLYPEGFEASRPTEDEVIIGRPGSLGHGPQAFIQVNVLGEMTVEQIADELLAPFTQLTPEPGYEGALQVYRSRGTLAGEQAVLLNGVPGQDIRRMVLVGHRGHLYELTFVPADRADEGYSQMEALFSTITGSLRFLDTATGEPGTPARADGTPTASTPGEAAADPQLVFASARSGHLELYAMPVSGITGPAAQTQLSVRQLTHMEGWTGFPAAAPDGKRIAFVTETRNADGSPQDREIYVLTLDGSQPVNLTVNAALDFDPAWSPDGTRLAFVSTRGGDQYSRSVYVLDVAEAAASHGSSGARLIAAHGEAPAWSPDGRQIAYISDQDMPGRYQVYLASTSGSDLRRVTNKPKTGNGAGVGRPVWSPDGSQLAVPADWEGNREIYLVSVAPGAEPVNVTHSPGYDDFPAWSPDGKRLAFLSDRAGRPGLYVAGASGSNIHTLAPDLAASLPCWSPDGTRLAFVGAGNNLNQDIYVIDEDGSNLVALTHDQAQDTFPTWVPTP